MSLVLDFFVLFFFFAIKVILLAACTVRIPYYLLQDVTVLFRIYCEIFFEVDDFITRTEFELG